MTKRKTTNSIISVYGDHWSNTLPIKKRKLRSKEAELFVQRMRCRDEMKKDMSMSCLMLFPGNIFYLECFFWPTWLFLNIRVEQQNTSLHIHQRKGRLQSWGNQVRSLLVMWENTQEVFRSVADISQLLN